MQKPVDYDLIEHQGDSTASPTGPAHVSALGPRGDRLDTFLFLNVAVSCLPSQNAQVLKKKKRHKRKKGISPADRTKKTRPGRTRPHHCFFLRTPHVTLQAHVVIPTINLANKKAPQKSFKINIQKEIHTSTLCLSASVSGRQPRPTNAVSTVDFPIPAQHPSSSGGHFRNRCVLFFPGPSPRCPRFAKLWLSAQGTRILSTFPSYQKKKKSSSRRRWITHALKNTGIRYWGPRSAAASHIYEAAESNHVFF